MEQVLINLLSNAIKFTEQGEVRIECDVENGWLVTRVIDTGIGIRPEDVDTLFKPFRQVDSGITRQYEGTGLGLSICKRLVEAMGGRIQVESEWGKGSTLCFYLAARKDPGMKATILVIEDNEKNLYLVTFILEKCGYQVVQARDGQNRDRAGPRDQPRSDPAGYPVAGDGWICRRP